MMWNRLMKLKIEWKKSGIELIEKQGSQKEDKSSISPCTYVCSDLHGEYPVYQSIVSKLKEGDKLYILGDVIDGTSNDDGIKILQDIMKRQKNGQVEFLMGNHEFIPLIEDKVFEKLDENPNLEYNKKDYHNFQEKTFYDLKALSNRERNEIKQFLLNSLVYKQINVGGTEFYLVHANSIKDSDKTSETVQEIIKTGRKSILKSALQDRTQNGDCQEKEIQKENVFTIIGHTPKENIAYNNYGALYIDCGVSYGKKEALVRLEDGNVMYFDAETEREKMLEKQNVRV